MTRRSWVYIDGVAYEKGVDVIPERPHHVMIAPDDQDFVSPIDGKLYRGRAGMREHNKIHDVVSNRDLVGLPYRTMHSEYKPDRAAIRGALVEAARKLGHI